MLLAQLREQVSNPQASASRPLPAVEREAKLRDLRTRPGGVVIEQQLEPSHHLIDLFSQQWEAKQLEYLSPEKCTSRECEIVREKSSKQLSSDNEKLLIKEEKSVPDQSASHVIRVVDTGGNETQGCGNGLCRHYQLGGSRTLSSEAVFTLENGPP